MIVLTVLTLAMFFSFIGLVNYINFNINSSNSFFISAYNRIGLPLISFVTGAVPLY